MKAKVNELGREKVKLVEGHKQQLLDISSTHEKAWRDQRVANDLAIDDARKENECLTNKVQEIEDKLGAQTTTREADITDAKNLVAGNFMKIHQQSARIWLESPWCGHE